MTIFTVRKALIGALVAGGLALGTAGAGNAAATAPVTFGPDAACAGGACVSSDPDLTLTWSSTANTAGCRFRLTIDWGDGGAAQTVGLTGAKDPQTWPVAHTYPGRVPDRRGYAVRARGEVTDDPRGRGCGIDDAALTFTLLCTGKQLSGPDWDTRWPGGVRDLAALNDEFRPGAEAFVAAMTRAGITVTPTSTLRSPQRSYLMHYSYLVAKQQLAASAVPVYAPIAGEKRPKVCWTHRDTTTGAEDPAASVAAARALLTTMGVDPSLRTAPALHSRHNTGDAIDMRTQWSASTIRIKTAAGRTIRISEGPHDGTNPKLIAVGATYGVHHFSPVAVDRNHWSGDGR